MKSIKDNTKLLVEQILNGNLLDANSTLTSLIAEAEEERERQIYQTITEAEGDEADSAADADVADETEADVEDGEGDEEGIDTTSIDEPTDGDPNLGDSLDNSVEDAAVSEAEMTEMSNDVVEIDCEINQKIISKLYDKISNLKTTLNAKDLDHDTREYITLETKLSYYGNKLEELQSKTNPAIDQSKVEERITKIEAALKTLESEIGSSSDISDVDDSVESGEVDDLGDNAETEVGVEGEGEEADTEGDVEETETDTDADAADETETDTDESETV